MTTAVPCLTTRLKKPSSVHLTLPLRENSGGISVFREVIYRKAEILILVPKSTIRFMFSVVKETVM